MLSIISIVASPSESSKERREGRLRLDWGTVYLCELDYGLYCTKMVATARSVQVRTACMCRGGGYGCTHSLHAFFGRGVFRFSEVQ